MIKTKTLTLEERKAIINNMPKKVLDDYIKFRSNGSHTSISKIINTPKEFDYFMAWFKCITYPFVSTLFATYCDEAQSVCRDIENTIIGIGDIGIYDFNYCWIPDDRLNKFPDAISVTGHDMQMIFKKYIKDTLPHLQKHLAWDSEFSMFCVYFDSEMVANEFKYELAELYRNKDKIIELMRWANEEYVKNLKESD